MDEWLRDTFLGFLAQPARHAGFYAQTLAVIPLLPLAGFAVNAFGWRRLPRRTGGIVACTAASLAFVWALLSFFALTGSSGAEGPAGAFHTVYGEWFRAGGFSCAFGLYLDPLSAVMILFVTGVGALIHFYSLGYMAHDAGGTRYFAYLNLFLSAMLVLVLADNLALMFVGWEGVGLCSYLLIGFWYSDAAKAEAGMKAFVFNRIGDLGFLLGIFFLFAGFGTVNFVAARPSAATAAAAPAPDALSLLRTSAGVEAHAEPGLLDYARVLGALQREDPALTPGLAAAAGSRVESSLTGHVDLRHTVGRRLLNDWSLGLLISAACVLLFVGACGKSAQFPLYAWLPDAMAGPTPVSALIHAATMVTAGVYLVTRLGGLFQLSPPAMAVVAAVGGGTALFAALIALTQTDIKKVLAYSTISQLGYMFLGAGVGACSLAMFHVVTHAFFKALLFLAAGSVIHALSGEQDLTRMGGLRKRLPVTFWTMLVGALALSGFPFTSGWFSKDALLAAVLERAHEGRSLLHYALYAAAAIAAACTAFYTFRLIALAFFGAPRLTPEAKAHLHESPRVMTVPLIILAVFSLVAGWLWHSTLPAFLGTGASAAAPAAGESSGGLHALNLAVTLAATLGGIGLALLLYVKQARTPAPEASANVLVRASWNKFYIDDLYTRVVGRGAAIGAELLHLVCDVIVIDTLLVGGVAFLTRSGARLFRAAQTGLVNAYALAVLGGALVLLYWLLR